MAIDAGRELSASPSRSRSSTPTSSHSSPASSDFLPSDPQPYAGWGTYSNSDMDMQGIDGKPVYGSFPSLSIGREDAVRNGISLGEDRGMLLEDIMQEDAFDSVPLMSYLNSQNSGQEVLLTRFEPALPNLPSYPSPAASSDDPTLSEEPMTVSLANAESQGSSLKLESTSDGKHLETAGLSPYQNLLVTHPNAPCPDAPIVEHPRDSLSNLPILIHNVPQIGAKSRVETQIKMTIDLAKPLASNKDYERVGSWKWMRLPKGTATRRRPRKEGKIGQSKNIKQPRFSLLTFSCASDPSMSVSACTNCLARETKRTERKKAARVRPQRLEPSDSEDGAYPPRSGGSRLDGQTGIVVFNCTELMDFSEGRVVLPVRVTCYCRHHREKLGFRLAFSLTDSQGRVVGRGTTPPIMITDDHKTVGKHVAHAPPVEDGMGEDRPTKRKKRVAKEAPEVDSEPVRVTKRRATKTRTSSRSGSQVQQFVDSNNMGNASPRQSLTPSAFTTAPSSPRISPVLPPPTLPLSTTPSHPLLSGLGYPDEDSYMSMNITEDLLTASLAALGNGADSLPTPTSSSMYSSPTLFNAAFPPTTPAQTGVTAAPQIHRLIPASGPTHGGIEVTILGANFLPTHRCVFGDTVASSTQLWSENTLVCLLPPSACPGPVVVSFEGIPLALGGAADGRGLQLFNYLDNSDRALMELALQVVGLKMTGRIEDAKNVAMRIVGNNTSGNEGSSTSSTGNILAFTDAIEAPLQESEDGPEWKSVVEAAHLLTREGQGVGASRDFQSVIIEFLCLLDLTVPSTSTVTAREAISHPNSSGQTLLHLSAMLGFHRLLKALIGRGIDADARDANGYTALHFAALCGRLACARMLVEGGADVEIVEASGRTAREVAMCRDQVDVELLLEETESLQQAFSEGGDDADESDVEEEVDYTDVVVGAEVEDFDVASPTATIRPSPPDEPEELDLSDSLSDKDSHFPDEAFAGWGPTDEKVGPVTPLSPPDDAPRSDKSFFHRTLSHLQPPLSGLPAMPAMPGFPIPQWGLLPNQLQFPQLQFPQLPLHLPVFPVQMPIWPMGFPWQGGAGIGADDDKSSRAVQSQGMLWGAYDLASPWLGWNNQAVDKSPPMYTPPEPSVTPIPNVEKPTTSPAPPSPMSSETFSSSSSSSSVKVQMPKSAMRVRFATRLRSSSPQDLPEREIHAYRYDSEKMQKQRKDRMLIWFWIPVLLFVIAWGLYESVPLAITVIRDVSTALMPPPTTA